MNYLGLDYGEKHVGVALSEGKLAQPLLTLARNKAVQLLRPLLKKYTVDAVVVGDCPEGFLNELAGLGVPIHQVDETLSTHDASQSLLHTTQSRRKSREHAAAAAIILQTWLDQNQ